VDAPVPFRSTLRYPSGGGRPLKPFAALIALSVLLGSRAHSQTTAASTPGLKPEQIPADCKGADGSFPIDIQTAILWQKTELYKSVMPLPVSKNAQSFTCQGNKGTVYFFQFGSEADRKTAATFIKPLLWGESGPTPDHPELVLEVGDVVSVVSFRKTPKLLLAALQNEIAHK
jgi:hypothetical protein